MDYTSQPLLFRVRKGLRYVRLYGPRRTWTKVKGQYHMKKSYTSLPQLDRGQAKGHVGIIGCGNFAFTTIAYYLHKNHGDVIKGVMDVDADRAASLAEEHDAFHTTDASDIVDDPDIDLVYIASNHASHATYAVEALKNGKHVHIEKPHVVTAEQLVDLCRTMQQSQAKVRLGFNRPASSFGRRIKAALEGQEGAAMFNWFIAGHAIDPEHWYFAPEEGGRILGNLCHWTDFVLQMVEPASRFPVTIRPTRAERSDSDIAVTYTFGDGSIASITFSAKGHTFEGVKERFAAHRGDALIALDDFHTLTIETGAEKKRYRSAFRDHGHERSVEDSYAMTLGGPGHDLAYVWETGDLFLKTKVALEQNQEVEVGPFQSRLLDGAREGAP